MTEGLLARDAMPVIKEIGSALLDAVYVVDWEGRFLTFNRGFYAMLPRAIARRLKTQSAAEIIVMRRGDSSVDLIKECFQKKQLVRYDEIQADVSGRSERMTVKVSAMPLFNAEDDVEAVMVTLRDVTDEGQVQQKYQVMLEEEARERANLQEKIDERTRELMQTRDELNEMQRELMKYRKGLRV